MNVSDPDSSGADPVPPLFSPETQRKLGESEIVRYLCDMYDLSDIANESFHFVDDSKNSPTCDGPLESDTYRPLRTSAPLVLGEEEMSLSSMPTTRYSGHISASSFSQDAPNLLFAPLTAARSQLTFPDYMLVYSESGVPIFVQEQGQPGGSAVFQSLGEPCGDAAYASDLPTTEDISEKQPRTVSSGSACKSKARGRPKKVATSENYHLNRRNKVIKRIPGCKTEKENNHPLIDARADNDESFVSTNDSDGFDEEDGDESTQEGESERISSEHVFPKPPYSYSTLVTIALKNSKNGRMTVRDIYNFMCKHFPYFRTAAAGWKNSVRHNLSLNPGFLKIVMESGPAKSRTACRWTLSPDKYSKMNEDVLKWNRKSVEEVKLSMRYPHLLSTLEEGKFADFRQAIQGVTVQKKNLGVPRRKSSRSSMKSDEGSNLSSTSPNYTTSSLLHSFSFPCAGSVQTTSSHGSSNGWSATPPASLQQDMPSTYWSGFTEPHITFRKEEVIEHH